MKICIIGAGQVGTSVALGVAKAAFADNIVLYDPNAVHIDELKAVARDEKVDRYIRGTRNIKKFKAELADANIVFLATPIGQNYPAIKEFAPFFKKGVLLTDAGSLKRVSIEGVVEGLTETGRLDDVVFLWSHPGKGTGGQGPKWATSYNNASLYIAPAPPKDAPPEVREAYNLLRNLWLCQKARVFPMEYQTHDMFFGVTSHLTHFLSFALMNIGHKSKALLPPFKDARTWLRNMTRFATASVPMWEPIALGNREVIGEAGENFIKRFEALEYYIARQYRDKLIDVLREAQAYRRSMARMDERDLVARETIFGELTDTVKAFYLGKPSPDEATHILERDPAHRDAFGLGTLLPYVIGVAATLNAKDKLEGLIDLAEHANPSFLDLSAPSLSDPVYMADLLLKNRDCVLKYLSAYRAEATRVLGDVKAATNGFVKELIEVVRPLRLEMPNQRRFLEQKEFSDAIRVEFMEPFFIPRPVAIKRKRDVGKYVV